MRFKELKDKTKTIKIKKHTLIKAVKFESPMKVNRMAVLR